MSSPAADKRELESPPDHVNAQLALWKRLAFHTDMAPNDRPDHSPSNDTGASTPNPSPYFQLPHTAPPQLPPETYNYLIHALLSLQGSASASHAYPHNYPPLSHPYPIPPGPLPGYNHPWPPSTAPPISTGPIAGPSSFYPTNPLIPLPPYAVPQTAGSSQLTASPATSPTTTTTAQDPEGTENAISITEDKRRRNTAASARFRVKKKLKTLDLERTVTDLTGRSEELEREATDLRRENAWLKEIVLLKGRNLLNLASQAPAHGDQCGEEDGNGPGESEPKSTGSRDKGKNRES